MTRGVQVLRTLFALAAAVGTLAAPLGGQPVRAAEAPFEIYAILSLTGQQAFQGNEELQTFQIAEDLINRSGGIRGRRVKFTIADDQTNPQITVQIANQLIAKNVPVILGPIISAACKAVLPLVAKAGPLTFCFTPAVEPPAGSYLFSSTVSTADTVTGGIRYLRERGATRLGLITTNDAGGQDVAQHLVTTLELPENKSVQIVAREHFNLGDISVSAQMARIKAANPQALYASTTGTPFGTLLHGISDAGLDIPVFTSFSNMTYEQMQQYAAFLPKELIFANTLGAVPGGVGRGAVRDAQERLFAAYRARSGRRTSDAAWDAITITVDAFKHAGLDATARQLADYVQQLHGWSGINGVYDFRGNAQRGIGLSSILVYRWDAARNDFLAVSRPGGIPR